MLHQTYDHMGATSIALQGRVTCTMRSRTFSGWWAHKAEKQSWNLLHVDRSHRHHENTIVLAQPGEAVWKWSTRLRGENLYSIPLFFFSRTVQGDRIGCGHAGRRGCMHSNSHGWLIEDRCLAVQHKADIRTHDRRTQIATVRWCSLQPSRRGPSIPEGSAPPAVIPPFQVIPASHTIFGDGSLSNLYIYCVFTSVLFLWATFEISEKIFHPHSKSCPALRRYSKRPLAKFHLIWNSFQRFMPWQPSALPRMIWDIHQTLHLFCTLRLLTCMPSIQRGLQPQNCLVAVSSIHITHGSGQSNGAIPSAGHKLLNTSSYGRAWQHGVVAARAVSRCRIATVSTWILFYHHSQHVNVAHLPAYPWAPVPMALPKCKSSTNSASKALAPQIRK